MATLTLNGFKVKNFTQIKDNSKISYIALLFPLLTLNK